MSQKPNTKQYIPDSSHAEEWLSADVFVYKGMRFLILPDGTIIHLRKNGQKSKEE